MQESKQYAAQQRLDLLFDTGTYQQMERKREAGGTPAGLLCAYGRVNGRPVCAFAQDHACQSGALGMAQTEMLLELYALAEKIGCPIVGIYDSDGAWVKDAARPLRDYGTLMQRAASLSGLVPQFSVVAGPCLGSAAIWAASADFLLMTQEGRLYLTPNATESPESAAHVGIAAAVLETVEEAIQLVRQLLVRLPSNNLESVSVAPPVPPVQQQATLAGLVDAGSFSSLWEAFGSGVTAGLAAIEGISVGMLVFSGSLHSTDCLKAARFLRICDAFSIPVVSILEHVEFVENNIAELRAMTRLAGCYGEATTGMLSIVTGEAIGSIGAIVLGKPAADWRLTISEAVIAPMAPLTAAEFFYHDALQGTTDLHAAQKQLADRYRTDVVSARAAVESGLVDQIVSTEQLRQATASALTLLRRKRMATQPKKHHTIPF